MVLRGAAKVRRVGNGLCVPLPTRELREEGIRAGDLVVYTVTKPRPINPKAFGMLRKELKGLDLHRLAGDYREAHDE